MAEHWQALVANLAVVALFISAWVHSHSVVPGNPPVLRKAAFGIVMGLGAIASMMLAIPLGNVFLDLRLSLVATAGLFGGPVAGLLAAAVAIAYRSYLGGAAVSVATVSILIVAAIGIAISAFSFGKPRSLLSVTLTAAAVAGTTLAVSTFLNASGMGPYYLPVAALNALATLLAAFFIRHHQVLEFERDLLQAAFLNSPDLQYVKDSKGRFFAVNQAVAKLNGFLHPEDMIGKSDFDITALDRAQSLHNREQEIFRTGEPLINYDEIVPDREGNKHWYLTSKVPLYESSGNVIGLAGVTRDITATRQLRVEAEATRNQLSYVLAGISDGVAMFAEDGALVYCNERYQQIFPYTTKVRQPGRNFREILEAVAATGEQKGIPAGEQSLWIDQLMQNLHVGGEQEIELVNGTWLHIRTRPTEEGASLVVVSDVTTIKAAETALLTMTEQLQLLATTDGLTDLTNRRAFDAALVSEIEHSRRSGKPLSLLMIDVDHFKSYNDLNGHQAGDAALKALATCLKGAVRRPTDVAARYGGEEFAAILPGTDEDGAFFVADAFRERLEQLQLEHKGTDKSVVTASIGIATYNGHDDLMTAPILLRRADEALYTAKDAGRNRVTGWRQHHDVPPALRRSMH